MQKLNRIEPGEMFCDVYCPAPGRAHLVHEGATKFHYVIEGDGRFTLGTRHGSLGPCGVAWAEPGEPHGVTNEGEGELVALAASLALLAYASSHLKAHYPAE